MVERNKKFTNLEFKQLDRNADGDVIDLAMCFMWLTDKQRDKLSSDDWSRIEEYEEECRIMLQEFI